MPVLCSFSNNLEVAINSFKGKIFTRQLKGRSFSNKVKIKESCHLDCYNIFQKTLCRKSFYEIYTKYRSGGVELKFLKLKGSIYVQVH